MYTHTDVHKSAHTYLCLSFQAVRIDGKAWNYTDTIISEVRLVGVVCGPNVVRGWSVVCGWRVAGCPGPC